MHNPYAGVAWDTHRQVKSLSHTHITYQSVFDKAVGLGFEHIPATDYTPSEPRYPLSDHFSNIPSGVIGSPNSEKVAVTDNYHYNALGSTLAGYGYVLVDGKAVKEECVDYETLFDQIFESLQYEDGGGVTINHPVYASNNAYAFEQRLNQCSERLDYDDRVLGIEVYNCGFEADSQVAKGYGHGYCYANMFPLWDAILSTGRRCYGFSVIDWFDQAQWDENGDGENEVHNYGAHMLLVPALDEHECLKAYRNGAFYGVIRDTGLRFTNIGLNGNIFFVTVNKTARLRIITDSRISEVEEATEATFVLKDSDIFVRVEAIDDTDTQDGIIFSNAIMLKTKEEVDGGGDEPGSEDEEKQRREKRKRFLLLLGGFL